MTLNDRIADLLRNDYPSEVIGAIFPTIEAEQARLSVQVEKVKRVSLDPLATDDDVATARREIGDLQFAAARLKSAVSKLEERQAAAIASEADVKRQAAYDEAVRERDAVVKEIRGEYLKLQHRAVEILTRLVRCEEQVQAVNRDRPAKAEWLAGPDRVALNRKLEDQNIFVQSVRMPAMLGAPAWPPPSRY